MNNCIKAALLNTILMASFAANAESCIPPKDEICAFYSPDNVSHVGVKVNFRNNLSGQVVYLNGGCEFGNYKFTPLMRINTINKYPHSKTSLKFTFCIGSRFVNEMTVETNSDSAIICNVSDKIVCAKEPD